MDLLYPSELEALGNVAPVRGREFSTGRVAARVALARLGQRPAPIIRDADRGPIWPDGLVGSLTHTRSHCAVAVALREDYASIGLDIESVTHLDDQAIELICTPQEMRVLGDAGLTRSDAALLVFSAKECFFKCQFPLTRRMLGFHDVMVDFDVAEEAFVVWPLGALPELADVELLEGRWAQCCGLIATGLALPAP